MRLSSSALCCFLDGLDNFVYHHFIGNGACIAGQKQWVWSPIVKKAPEVYDNHEQEKSVSWYFYCIRMLKENEGVNE